MVVLAFGEYLLVLRGLTPLAAMKESLRLSRGNFWRILLCILCVLVPLWLLKGARLSVYPPPQNPPIALLIDSVPSFLHLFTTLLLFGSFLMAVDKPDRRYTRLRRFQ